MANKNRSYLIDAMKRQGHVGYFVDIAGYGASGVALLCRGCYDTRGADTHEVAAIASDLQKSLGLSRQSAIDQALDLVKAGTTSLDFQEACTLAVQEGHAPMCDNCGHDIRNPKES